MLHYTQRKCLIRGSGDHPQAVPLALGSPLEADEPLNFTILLREFKGLAVNVNMVGSQ